MVFNGLTTRVSPRKHRKSAFSPKLLRLEPVFTKSLRSTPSCIPPALCGGSEVEGDGAGGVMLQHPHTQTIPPPGLE